MDRDTLWAAIRQAAQPAELAGIYVSSLWVAASHDTETDVVVRIVWSMLGEQVGDSPRSGIEQITMSRPSDSVLRLPRGLASMAEIEDALLDVAYAAGAWDVVRTERPALADPREWRQAGHGLTRDMGCAVYMLDGTPIADGGGVGAVICAAAARTGWASWHCKPLALCSPGMRKRWLDKDHTLDTHGRREGQPDFRRAPWALPQSPGRAHQTIYKLGRSTTDAVESAVYCEVAGNTYSHRAAICRLAGKGRAHGCFARWDATRRVWRCKLDQAAIDSLHRLGLTVTPITSGDAHPCTSST